MTTARVPLVCETGGCCADNHPATHLVVTGFFGGLTPTCCYCSGCSNDIGIISPECEVRYEDELV